MLEDPDGIELDETTEDPAGGVRLPPRRRDMARAFALAGVAVGLSAIAGIAGYPPPTTITSITV